MKHVLRMLVLLVLLVLLAALGCADGAGSHGFSGHLRRGNAPPDVAPVMVNEESPFRYPPALWAQRVQGNVTLRVIVDSLGLPVADSTTIATSSGIASLDSAALAGAASLKFRPALSHNAPVRVALLLPVFFRHPAAPPLPGDSAIKRDNKPPNLQ